MRKTYNKPSVKTVKLNTESLMAASPKLDNDITKSGDEKLESQESNVEIWNNNRGFWE